MTIVQGPVREAVHQGPKKTPFYPRVEKLDTVNQWHEWKGYSSPDALFCPDQEYFAIRNGTGVFDLSPMTKYRITGPAGLPQPSGYPRHGESQTRSRRVCGVV